MLKQSQVCLFQERAAAMLAQQGILLTPAECAAIEIADFGLGEIEQTPGRGLDISWAEYQGRPLCWRSTTGEVHPAFYEPEDKGWLRSFFGGEMLLSARDRCLEWLRRSGHIFYGCC